MNPRVRRFLHDEWLQLLIIALPLIAALVAMPFATHKVPMQWNARGQVNWYAPKEWGLLAIPVGMLFTYAILYWREAMDPGRVRSEDGLLTSHGKATRTIRLILSIMVVMLCFAQIATAIGRSPDLGRWATAACPFVLALVGNFFGKLKPNRYIGVRVPWTLRSETVWRRTHRVAGWLYTIGGLIAGALCLFVAEGYLLEILVAWLAVIILVPLGVAWQAAREERSTAPAQVTNQRLGWMALLEAVVLSGIIAFYFQKVASDPRHAPDRKAAQIAAEQWLTRLDDGDYPQAWQTTGTAYQKAIALPAQLESWNKYRKPAGAKLSRKLREASYTESLRGAPPGKYVVVRFDTIFANKEDAVETVVETLEPDGNWRVGGYFIK